MIRLRWMLLVACVVAAFALFLAGGSSRSRVLASGTSKSGLGIERQPVSGVAVKRPMTATDRLRKRRAAQLALMRDEQSWEGKPIGEMTGDEREAIGATPIGYYTSRQSVRWLVVQDALRRRRHFQLMRAVESLRADLRTARIPYAEYDAEALVAKQDELLNEIQSLELDFRVAEFSLDEIEEINRDFLDNPQRHFAAVVAEDAAEWAARRRNED